MKTITEKIIAICGKKGFVTRNDVNRIGCPISSFTKTLSRIHADSKNYTYKASIDSKTGLTKYSVKAKK